ncbi:hypothetical protein [Peterkaempfera sp. SMS 1(5)a]
MAQALLGYHSEAQWLRNANKHLPAVFPYLPQRPGYHKRLKAAVPLLKHMIRELAMDSDFWTDTVWVADSTNDTLNGQLDLARHGGRTFEGVAVRVTQRVPAMTVDIWRNNLTGAAVVRSLIAYDH